MRVVRVTAGGELDTTFSDDGTQVISFPFTDAAAPEDVALQPDGRVVVFGSARLASATQRLTIALARLRTDGSLDPSFSDDGRAIGPTPVAVQAGGGSVQLGPDGRIVVLGGSYGLFVARYTADGRRDPSFSSDGYAEPPVPQFEAGSTRWADGVLQDERILAIGDSPGEQGTTGFAVARVLGGNDPPPGDSAAVGPSPTGLSGPAPGASPLTDHDLTVKRPRLTAVRTQRRGKSLAVRLRARGR